MSMKEKGRLMKNLVRIGVAMLMLMGAASQSQVDRSKIEQDVRGVLDRYIHAVENEDLDEYAAVVGHDGEMVNFGAFGAPIVGWESLRAVMEEQNAALDSIRVEQSQVAIRVLSSGDDAWATSLWRFRAKSGKDTVELPVRCT
jgi:ketosteroid isomerase-like protein